MTSVVRRACSCGSSIEFHDSVRLDPEIAGLHADLLDEWAWIHDGPDHQPVDAATARAVRDTPRRTRGPRYHAVTDRRPDGSNPARWPLCGVYNLGGVDLAPTPEDVTCAHCRRILDGV